MSDPGAVAAEAAARPVVAAFDFDGTLTDGGSVFAFLLAVRGPLPVLAAVVRAAPGLVKAAALGGAAADRTKEALFTRLLGGQDAARVDAVAARFAARHLAQRLRPEVRDRLEWHRAHGHRVVIVSASPECYVRPAGAELGVDGVLATRLAVDASGRLTGRYEGKNCRGAEKFGRLVGWLRANGLAGAADRQPVLWAYGNSRGDLRLLQAADHGIDAGKLGRLGRLHPFARLATLTDVPEAVTERAGAPPAPGSGGGR